jgi:hypothetical protein
VLRKKYGINRQPVWDSQGELYQEFYCTAHRTLCRGKKQHKKKEYQYCINMNTKCMEKGEVCERKLKSQVKGKGSPYNRP